MVKGEKQGKNDKKSSLMIAENQYLKDVRVT